MKTFMVVSVNNATMQDCIKLEPLMELYTVRN